MAGIIKFSETQPIRMAGGNENKFTKAIFGPGLYEWAIGCYWTRIRDATDADKKKYLTVVGD